MIAFTLLSGPTPTGTVVIDAVPWASITAIETESGEPVALPPSPSTPISLTLPVGTYQVVMTGPPPESQTQRITVQVVTGAATAVPLIKFRALTPEEYFEEYLAAPTTPEAGTAPVEPPPATPAPSSPVASPEPVSKP